MISLSLIARPQLWYDLSFMWNQFWKVHFKILFIFISFLYIQRECLISKEKIGSLLNAGVAGKRWPQWDQKDKVFFANIEMTSSMMRKKFKKMEMPQRWLKTKTISIFDGTLLLLFAPVRKCYKHFSSYWKFSESY